MSELYIVGTPIGNLGDITFRALETFKSVDVIAAEDTRHTLELLTHFEIRKPLVSCRAQNEGFASEKIIQMLNKGQKEAYASDAGTPGISDPGAVLAEKARSAGHRVIPIPGPSAFATLASVAGSGGKTLVFEGFLSPKPGRRRSRLRELMGTPAACIVYESPFRVVKLLADIAEIDDGGELEAVYEDDFIRAAKANNYSFSNYKIRLVSSGFGTIGVDGNGIEYNNSIENIEIDYKGRVSSTESEPSTT